MNVVRLPGPDLDFDTRLRGALAAGDFDRLIELARGVAREHVTWAWQSGMTVAQVLEAAGIASDGCSPERAVDLLAEAWLTVRVVGLNR